MPEGDADFRGWLRRIEQMVHQLSVPVIVKETGCGMGMEQIRMLSAVGVAAVDIGGAGGTNFLAIENFRTGQKLSQDLLAWGIPTAVSALEAIEVLPPTTDLIVSGGVRTPLDAAKALAIGAAAVGIAAPLLRLTEQSDVAAAVLWLEQYLKTLKKLALLLGRQSVAELRSQPMVIGGKTSAWLSARGIAVDKYARRNPAGER